MDRDQEEAAHHQDMLNREREALEALQQCADAKVDMKALKVLARECGLKDWGNG